MAFAALTTGGTFSSRGVGNGLAATKPASPVFTAVKAVEDLDEAKPPPCVAVVPKPPEAKFPPTWPPGWLLEEAGKSCRRTGSEPD